MLFMAKLAQATGMTVVMFDFVRKFPDLMSPKILGIGVLIFGIGWLMQKRVVQK